MDILGLSLTAVKKLRSGDAQTLKLDGGVRLAGYLGVSPWYLARLKDRADMLVETDDAAFTVSMNATRGDAIAIAKGERAVVSALQRGGFRAVSWTRRTPLRNEASPIDDDGIVLFSRSDLETLKANMLETQRRLAVLETEKVAQRAPRRQPKAVKSL